LLAVTLVAVPVTAYLGPGGADSLPLVLPIVAGLLLNSTSLMFDGLLRAAGRAGRSGLNLTVQSVTALACAFALLGLGLGSRAGAYAFLAGAIVRLISSLAWSRDLWRARAEPAEPAPTVP